MRLKIGDKIYLRPDKASKLDLKSYDIDVEKYPNIKDVPFTIINTRQKNQYTRDDICVEWVDGTDWWWGQIGETEPWTMLFISETQYKRYKKLEEIGI